MELLRELRADRSGPGCAVVILTGASNAEVSRAVTRAGADGFVGKSWMSVESLTRAVENAIERNRLAGDLRRQAAALRASEERFRLASGAAHAMVYDIDLRSARMSLHGLYHLMGYDENESDLTPAWWEDRILPEDLPGYRAAFATLRARPGGQTISYRLRHKDGRTLWVQDSVTPFIDKSGDVVRHVGTVVDITEQRGAQETLARREAELRSITDNLPAIVARFDRDLRHVFVNATVTRATGLPPEAFLGKTNRELWMPSALCDQWDGAMRQVLATGQPTSLSFSFNAPTGERRFEAQLVPEPGPDGSIDHLLAITRDTTEAWQVSEELARAKEVAESANAAKDRFLAVLSHELRTPLTPVHMTVSMWEREADRLPPRFVEELAMVRRNVELECRLIDDMLDLNRIARGKLELQFTPTDLHTEIRHVFHTVSQDASDKQVVLSFDADASDALVLGDPGRLQQVLWNLLRNAVKFTPPGGWIAVTTSDAEDGRVRVMVRDSGIGFEPDRAAKLFDAFEQGDSQITRQFGGLGLGLSISKVLVEMHGGTLNAASEGRGRGATFTLELQVAAPREKSAAERDSDPRASSMLSPARTPRCRILLVEDHKDTARVMKHLLGSAGHDVQTADSVAAALDMDQNNDYDLVISDLGLPDGTGHDLLRQLIARRPVKAIALSGYGMEEDVNKATAAGFSAHLTKPVSMEQLQRAIQRVVEAVKSGKIT